MAGSTKPRRRWQTCRPPCWPIGLSIQGAGDWSPEMWLIDAAAADGDLQALEQILAEVAVGRPIHGCRRRPGRGLRTPGGSGHRCRRGRDPLTASTSR